MLYNAIKRFSVDIVKMDAKQVRYMLLIDVIVSEYELYKSEQEEARIKSRM